MIEPILMSILAVCSPIKANFFIQSTYKFQACRPLQDPDVSYIEGAEDTSLRPRRTEMPTRI